jgi:AraC-like DNA-binding protein
MVNVTPGFLMYKEITHLPKVLSSHNWPGFRIEVGTAPKDEKNVVTKTITLQCDVQVTISLVVGTHRLTVTSEMSYMNSLMEVAGFTCVVKQMEDDFMFDILTKLFEQILDDHPVEKMYMETLVVSLLLHVGICYSHPYKKIFAPKGKLSAGQLMNVASCTRDSMNTNISLSLLASAAHLSPFHFSRVFRSTMRKSPYQYVLRSKIEYAQKIMQQQQKSLSDIAYALNFTDQAHFSNTFKRITGVCPKAFLQSRIQ